MKVLPTAFAKAMAFSLALVIGGSNVSAAESNTHAVETGTQDNYAGPVKKPDYTMIQNLPNLNSLMAEAPAAGPDIPIVTHANKAEAIERYVQIHVQFASEKDKPIFSAAMNRFSPDQLNLIFQLIALKKVETTYTFTKEAPQGVPPFAQPDQEGHVLGRVGYTRWTFSREGPSDLLTFFQPDQQGNLTETVKKVPTQGKIEVFLNENLIQSPWVSSESKEGNILHETSHVFIYLLARTLWLRDVKRNPDLGEFFKNFAVVDLDPTARWASGSYIRNGQKQGGIQKEIADELNPQGDMPYIHGSETAMAVAGTNTLEEVLKNPLAQIAGTRAMENELIPEGMRMVLQGKGKQVQENNPILYAVSVSILEKATALGNELAALQRKP